MEELSVPEKLEIFEQFHAAASKRGVSVTYIIESLLHQNVIMLPKIKMPPPPPGTKKKEMSRTAQAVALMQDEGLSAIAAAKQMGIGPVGVYNSSAYRRYKESLER